jgi:tRNA1(Val) A37 N6-methylase TrmN6
MSVIVNVMVFGDVMKHVAQELSEKGRLVLTSEILRVCGFAARCVLSSLKTDDICTVLTREERELFTNISV